MIHLFIYFIVTILEGDQQELALAQFLGATEITDLSILSLHIFPLFSSFTPAQQSTITDFVKVQISIICMFLHANVD